MKILLVGSSGFIGSHILRKLENKHTVIKFSLRDGFDMSIWDDVEKACADANAIFHFGATAVGRRNATPDPHFADTDYSGVRNFVRAAEMFHIPLIFSSSIRVYGTTEEMKGGEDGDVHPASVYGQMKLDCENIIKNSAAQWIILRIAAVYGKGMPEDFIISSFCRTISRGEPIILTSTGQQKRNFVCAEDLAECISLLADYTFEKNEIINVAHHETVNLLELIKLIGGILGKKVDVRPAHVDTKDPDELISIRKVEKLLGWRAKTDLVRGLERCYAHEIF
ncbi:MAG: NAD(P)-dependent oxidoreductase [Patescibacteria group bacterium]